MSPQNQAGCEQSNGRLAKFKNKLSNKMGVEMIRARSRVGENGPPMTLFNAKAAAKNWRDNGHRYAKVGTTAEKSKTLKRIRKEEKEKYTSTILL